MRFIVEQYPTGSIAVTRIGRSVVKYDVFRVGQCGWGVILPIKKNNWRERQHAAIGTRQSCGAAGKGKVNGDGNEL